jgi:uncharacterized protein YjbI with pentapeptide repeats
MAGTFLGKWVIYLPSMIDPAGSGYASFRDVKGPWRGTFCLWSAPPPPVKEMNIAFILRDDGQLCFLLNNGSYVYLSGEEFDWWKNVTLENAAGFVLPQQDPQNPPAIYIGWLQSNGLYAMIDPIDASFVTTTIPDSYFGPYIITQVTLSPPSIKKIGTGEGMDFSWVDLTGVDLDHCLLSNADFSNCNLTGVNFSSSDLSGADLTGANLTGATLTDCVLAGTTLSNCNLTGTDFTSANLSGANLTGSTFTNTKLSSANMVGAIFTGDDLSNVIANPIPKFYNAPLSPPSLTNPRTTLAGCRLNQSLLANDWSMIDLTGATMLSLSSPLSSSASPLQAKYSILTGLNENNLSGLSVQSAVFDDSLLDGVDLSHADLSNASFIEASLHGANLTNATLEGANMTGAQLGSLSRLFMLSTSYETDLNAGPGVDASLVGQFTQHGITLSLTATLNTLSADHAWELNDAGNNIVYTIRLETQADSTQALCVYKPATAASLAGAYMPNAILTGANLYGITANNIQFYGSKAKIDDFAILEEAKLNGSNLSTVNFTQAQLLGANLSSSYLFNAGFRGANLTPSASGGAADLSYANLQGVDFTDAQLYGANLANAAVAINTPTTANPNQGGVYLFSLPYMGGPASLLQYTVELNAASTKFSLNPQGDASTLQKYLADLSGGRLTDFIISFLKQHPPIRLSASAQIETISPGSVWQIVDGAQSYTLWTDIDESGNTELYAAPSLTNTRAAFGQHGLTLRWQASTEIDTTDSQWLIDNDSENPLNTATGYVRFIVKLNGSVLDFYGASIRITRLGDNNQMTYDTETCNLTKLTATNMNGDTICPNGKKLSVNQSESASNWNVWMRASAPPLPPTCVPTDYSWCPQASQADNRTKQ